MLGERELCLGEVLEEDRHLAEDVLQAGIRVSLCSTSALLLAVAQELAHTPHWPHTEIRRKREGESNAPRGRAPQHCPTRAASYSPCPARSQGAVSCTAEGAQEGGQPDEGGGTEVDEGGAGRTARRGGAPS